MISGRATRVSRPTKDEVSKISERFSANLDLESEKTILGNAPPQPKCISGGNRGSLRTHADRLLVVSTVTAKVRVRIVLLFLFGQL